MFRRGDAGEGRDIFRGERRRPRSRWRGLRFLIGGYYSGRFGLAVLAVFMTLGVGVMVYQNWFAGPSNTVSVEERGDAHPETGRPLTAQEAGMAARFGEPLYLGDQGYPVVRDRDSGEVREVTPVEVDFPSGVLFQDAEGGAVWAPGPRGWGIWWDQETVELEGRLSLRMDRDGWVARQNEELARALVGLEYATEQLALWSLDDWTSGRATGLAMFMDAYRAEYPEAKPGFWGLVPGRWYCDEQLEKDLRHGVTVGCPSGALVSALEGVWVEIGLYAETLSIVADLGRLRDGLTARQISSLNVDRSMGEAAQDLLAIRDRLPVALERLDGEAERNLVNMEHHFMVE